MQVRNAEAKNTRAMTAEANEGKLPVDFWRFGQSVHFDGQYRNRHGRQKPGGIEFSTMFILADAQSDFQLLIAGELCASDPKGNRTLIWVF